MKKENFLIRSKQWQYAKNLLTEHGITTTDTQPKFTGRNCENLIISSNQLYNVILIRLQDTADQIKEKILRQIEIAKAYK